MFPRTQLTPVWYREGYGFHLSRSLLAMALIGNKNTDFGPWLMSTATICHHSRWSAGPAKKWMKSDSIVRAIIKLYTQSVHYHQPSLVNFFLWDDYDFLPSDSDIAQALYEIGHRHSLLYFHEVRIILVLIVLVVTFLVYGLTATKRISTTVAGVIYFYPSLILSFFERPYLHLIPLNLVLLVGWPFVGLKRFLLSLQLIAIIISPIFLFGLALRMGSACQFRSPDRFMCNALLPQFKYTGYSPLRLFRRSKDSSIPLQEGAIVHSRFQYKHHLSRLRQKWVRAFLRASLPRTFPRGLRP